MNIERGKKYSRDELSEMGLRCLRQRTCGVAHAFSNDKIYQFGVRSVEKDGEFLDVYDLRRVSEV